MPFDPKQEDIIASFLGIPKEERRRSKSKEPNPLSDLIEQVSDFYGFDQPSAEQELVQNWHFIFGSYSERCFPIRINNKNVLMLSVANPTLRSEIAFEKMIYLKKIKQLNHCQHIVDLNITA